MISASQRFIFLDDVNFIKKGWINRNNILLNGHPYRFTIPLCGVSQNRKINELHVATNQNWQAKFAATLHQAYKKAPHYSTVAPLILEVLQSQHQTISDLAIASVSAVCAYLGVEMDADRSSCCSPETASLAGADRLLAIAIQQGLSTYINPIGGQSLYSRELFISNGVDIAFCKPCLPSYQQFQGPFVNSLSIIDVLMFNSVQETRSMLDGFILH